MCCRSAPHHQHFFPKKALLPWSEEGVRGIKYDHHCAMLSPPPWSLKLSNVGMGQYLDGRQLRNFWCYWQFFLTFRMADRLLLTPKICGSIPSTSKSKSSVSVDILLLVMYKDKRWGRFFFFGFLNIWGILSARKNHCVSFFQVLFSLLFNLS